MIKTGDVPTPEGLQLSRICPPLIMLRHYRASLDLQTTINVSLKKLYNLHASRNELLKKDKKWRWTPECQTAFDQIKKAFTSDLFLTHYDPNLEINVPSDASSYGVGSCILHKMPEGTKKPIAHASRTLLLAEKHYSQIEKGALGIIFAVTKFHRYLHGRCFII